MPPIRFTLSALVVLLLVTGGRTRPVEAMQERFERAKPPAVVAWSARA